MSKQLGVSAPSIVKQLGTRFGLLLAFVFASTGCSNLTPQQCLFADWYAMGAQAAKAGEPVTSFMLHQRDCGKHGINPDRWDFVLGWEAARQGESS